MLNKTLSKMGFQVDGNSASLYIKKPSTYNQVKIMITDNESGNPPTDKTRDFAISVSYINNHGDTMWSFNTWEQL